MRAGGMILGVILVIAGSLILLFSFDMEYYNLLDFWPVVLILIGLIILTNRPRKKSLHDIASGRESDDTK